MTGAKDGVKRWPVTGPRSVLGREALDRMHETALVMLEKTGMFVENPEVREAIGKREGFTPAGGRVRISRNKVESLVASLRKAGGPVPASIDPDVPLTLGVDTRASYIVERDGRSLRPMTRVDVVESAKLVTMLHDRGVSGTTTGVPTDIPGPLVPLEQFMISAEYSRSGGATNDVTDLSMAKVIREMNKVYGRGLGLSVWNPSPLVLGGEELRILWHFRDEVEWVYVGSMPCMGMTAPCDPVATFTVAMAECLGGAAIIHELIPKAWLQVGPHPEPADMASGVMVFGTPEWELLELMHRDVHGYYGSHTTQKLIHTTASVPGAQAVADHMAGMMLGGVYGYTRFAPGGMLALDEVYSPAMLVLDTEMKAHVRRVVRGVWSGEGLDLESLPGVVAEAVAEGGVFAGHETTVANMRKQYHQPKVLKRLNRTQWEKAGRPDEVKEAQAEADRLVASFNYEPPRDVLKELRRIYEDARRRLA